MAKVTGNTALIDGVRKYAMDVRELDIDLIDRINPFGEAYAILAKTMSEESLRQVQAVISAKKVQLSPDEARACERASSSSMSVGGCRRLHRQDPWEKKMAEGVAYLARMKQEAANG